MRSNITVNVNELFLQLAQTHLDDNQRSLLVQLAESVVIQLTDNQEAVERASLKAEAEQYRYQALSGIQRQACVLH